MSEDIELTDRTIVQVAAAAATAFAEVCALHPLDLVKTRLQLQGVRPAPAAAVSGSVERVYYTGVVDCVRSAFRREGFSALWKGVIPPLLIETPKRAVNFLVFEQYKKFFMFSSEAPTVPIYYIAGLCVGITEAFLINPFEVVKVTMQSNEAQPGQMPSTWAVTKDIIRKQGFGLQGLNRGLMATVAASGSFGALYFGIFHSLKGRLRVFSDPTLYLFHIMAIGLASGTLASIVNNPFDVAKSRIQGPQPEPGVVKYRTLFATVRTVYKEEGWRALFKGTLAKALRFGPGGALAVAVYDYSYRYLDESIPA